MRGFSRLPPLAAALIAAAMGLAGCGGRTPTGRADSDARGARAEDSTVAAAAVVSSHDRMLALLAEIERRTPEENLYLGDRPAREAAAALAALGPDADALERFRRLRDLGIAELDRANETDAIARLDEAVAMLPRLVGRVPVEESREARFRLAVAWLRRGESQNCALRHNSESCILPIRGAGVHVEQEGSRQAMRHFLELAAETADDRASSLHLKSVWLANIAAMTVGEYPGGVPEAFRIPPEVFASEAPFPRFENAAPELGLAAFNLFGSAIAEDFDGDGWIDLFTSTAHTSERARLYRNDRDGTFTDVSDAANLEGINGGLNAVQADYDNDGDADVVVLRGAWLRAAGRHPKSLLQNDGHGRFSDVTFAAGMGERYYPTQTANWADYDNDGDLDLYVGHEEDGRDVVDAPCQLWRNEGNGTFTEVAAAAGVETHAFVKGVVWGDYDADRFPDLYVSVNGGPNRLYHNNHDGTFTDVARQAGVALPMDSFPVWFWDYDNDGALDLYVAAYRGVTGAVAAVALSYFGGAPALELGRLYKGDGRGGFRDVALELGLTRLHLAMGSNFGDLDNDGWLDFYLGTGYPDYEALQPNAMYRNDQGRRFQDVTWNGGFGHLQKGHAVAFADFDQDGDQDVFEQMGGTYAGDRASNVYYRNPGFGRHWIALQLEGTRSNRSAIGARLRVDVVEGGSRRSIHRWVTSGGSFGASPLRQSIGLGAAATVERIEVYWPTSDTTQAFTAVVADRVYRVVEGEDALEELHLAPPSTGPATAAR
jgi:FG-GAP-like repeat/ASPIC and UnbV